MTKTKSTLSALALAGVFALSIPVHSQTSNPVDWTDPNASWNSGLNDANNDFFGADQSDEDICTEDWVSPICVEGMISDGLDPADCPVFQNQVDCNVN